MPLVALSDHEAVSNRKTNPAAGWGGRGGPNRVEPVALPRFEVPFKLRPGEKIFTIGSCFARNVETELSRRGFQLPVWELFKRPDFAKLNLGIINNYGTPSIYNEIAWAFGEAPFVPKHHILEVREGKFADIHLEPSLRPEPFEAVLGRRTAIAEAYRTAASCSVVIMTLGLAELWFDSATGFYLNVAPRPSLIEKHPGRFQLHVLSFEEAFDYLDRAIAILRRNAPSLNVLLTVSPVPMMSTHRPIDVMVANTYSKALLRTAAETVVTKYDFVAYYPSFESVTLSDRAIAWMDDMVHVTRDMVALNVGRMIEAFIEDEAGAEEIRDRLSAVEKAKAAKPRGKEYCESFFRRNAEWSRTSREFAIEHARHLLSVGEPAQAHELLAAHGAPDVNVAILMGQALVALGRGGEAFDFLEPFSKRHNKSVLLWEQLLAAAMQSGDIDRVNAVLWRFHVSVTGRTAPAFLRAARWFAGREDKQRALVLAKAAMDEPLLNANALELAEILIELGELGLARRALELVVSPAGFEITRRNQLQAFLGTEPVA